MRELKIQYLHFKIIWDVELQLHLMQLIELLCISSLIRGNVGERIYFYWILLVNRISFVHRNDRTFNVGLSWVKDSYLIELDQNLFES